MVQELRSLKKTSHFFQGLTLGAEGGGGGGGGGLYAVLYGYRTCIVSPAHRFVYTPCPHRIHPLYPTYHF